MNPYKVDRNRLQQLTDLPNIGKAMAADLQLLGIRQPQDLIACDPYQLYRELCATTGVLHDPCVLDVFISIVRFIQGDDPQPWWHYTAERKQRLSTQPSCG